MSISYESFFSYRSSVEKNCFSIMKAIWKLTRSRLFSGLKYQ